MGGQGDTEGHKKVALSTKKLSLAGPKENLGYLSNSK